MYRKHSDEEFRILAIVEKLIGRVMYVDSIDPFDSRHRHSTHAKKFDIRSEQSISSC